MAHGSGITNAPLPIENPKNMLEDSLQIFG